MIICEEIIKPIIENLRADQNTLFCRYVMFEPPSSSKNQIPGSVKILVYPTRSCSEGLMPFSIDTY